MREDGEAIRDLRATSDSIRTDSDRLSKLEDEKRNLSPSDPRMIEASAEVVEVARDIEQKSEAELELSEKARIEETEDRPN